MKHDELRSCWPQDSQASWTSDKASQILRELSDKLAAVDGLNLQKQNGEARLRSIPLPDGDCYLVRKLAYEIGDQLTPIPVWVPTPLEQCEVWPQFQNVGDWIPSSALTEYPEHCTRHRQPKKRNGYHWHVAEIEHESSGYVHLKVRRVRYLDFLATTKVLDQPYGNGAETTRKLLEKNFQPTSRAPFPPAANLLSVNVVAITSDKKMVALRGGADDPLEQGIYGIMDSLIDVDRDRIWQPNPIATAFKVCCNRLGFALREPIRWTGVGQEIKVGNVSLFGYAQLGMSKAEILEAFVNRPSNTENETPQFPNFDESALGAHNKWKPLHKASLVLALKANGKKITLSKVAWRKDTPACESQTE